MTTLILGGQGMLGAALSRLLRGEIVSVDIEECDLTDGASVKLLMRKTAPDVVINTAAYTDVDGCEDHPEAAMAVNGEAAGHVARACADHGVRLIHISTDYVFDGEGDTPYTEDHPVNPVSVYGKSKLLGEKNAALCPDHVILRVSWLFGPGRNHFLSLMARFIREGRELNVIKDQVGRITYTIHTAEAITRILATSCRGILHFANSGAAGRFEQVRWMAAHLGREDLSIRPVPSSHFPQKARRPMYAVMDTSRFESLTGWIPPHWTEAVRHFLENESWD